MSSPRAALRHPKSSPFSEPGKLMSEPCSVRRTRAWEEASMHISTGCKKRSRGSKRLTDERFHAISPRCQELIRRLSFVPTGPQLRADTDLTGYTLLK